MLKISHISKTFNPGTVNEKKAIEDLSLELKSSVPMVQENQHSLTQSAVIFLQMQGRSNWTAGISHLCRSMHAQKKSAVFIRIPCAELHQA